MKSISKVSFRHNKGRQESVREIDTGSCLPKFLHESTNEKGRTNPKTATWIYGKTLIYV
jgi:hypothetical protein